MAPETSGSATERAGVVSSVAGAMPAGSESAATLGAVLEAHRNRQPQRAFLIAPETGRTYTYADLAGEAARIAAFLAARGVVAGDVVGMLLHNGWQTAAIFLGTMAHGYLCAPFNLLSSPRQLAYVLAHSECKLVFTSREHEALLREAIASAERQVDVEVIDVDGGPGPVGPGPSGPGPSGPGPSGPGPSGPGPSGPGPSGPGPSGPGPSGPGPSGPGPSGPGPSGPGPAGHRPSPDSPALLMYTSGTTGTPKGALLTHANLVAAARAVSRWHGLSPDDRVLSSLPLYHINGQVIATVTPFVSGGSIVAPHRFSVGNWWALVERHRPTWLNMVPTIIAYLLNAAEPGRRYDLPFVRFGRSASAPLPPDQHRAFERTFGIGVIEAMGMTESASVVFCNPQDPKARKFGTPGLPCGVEARVIDRAGRVLGDGETGELMLRGPNVMSAYHKSPEQTRAALEPDGWLHTGDLGYRDADGFYFVTGRIKELIIKGGENIAPREIDEALLRHPAVLEAAAVGIPDANYGQDILACVVLKAGRECDEPALRAHCLAELGRYKTPREFRFMTELPKGPSGKVQRLKLLDA